MKLEKLVDIDKKLDKIVTLLEGACGSTGLVKQVEENSKSLESLKLRTYTMCGVIAVFVPAVKFFL